MKSYEEVSKIENYYDRLLYLMLHQVPSDETFGSKRYMNQMLYKSQAWKTVRRDVIIRDEACDLGCGDHMMDRYILIHHINPITIDDIIQQSDKIFDMNNLICVSRNTHNLIHYGNEEDIRLLKMFSVERRPGDTNLW
jgi:predicted HNH restriction endonuclease